jgi:hypothetical protein
MGLESESYSEAISFLARRSKRAFAWALLAMQRPYGKCSWNGESAHDGSIADSRAMARAGYRAWLVSLRLGSV